MTTAAQESIEVAGLRAVGTSLALERLVAIAGASPSDALITGGSHRYGWT